MIRSSQTRVERSAVNRELAGVGSFHPGLQAEHDRRG
jgi:hypothetical protein